MGVIRPSDACLFIGKRNRGHSKIPARGIEKRSRSACGGQSALGFMGIAENRLEMLFLLPEERGKGFGGRFLRLATEKYGGIKLAVNEQNPLVRGFCEHMGFTVYKRSELDEQGTPYPLLYKKGTDKIIRSFFNRSIINKIRNTARDDLHPRQN